MDTTGLIVVAAVLVLGTAAGGWRRRTDGRLRSVTAPAAEAVSASALPGRAAGPDPARHTMAPGVAGFAPGTADAGGFAQGEAGTAQGVVVAAKAAAGASDAATGGAEDSESVASGGIDPSAAGERIDPELLRALGVQPAQATLLQFSSAFCAPCRAVRRVSAEVVGLLPQVQHVEVDAESHLDAVRALGIWRTPTLLVLDADGRVARRATGVPGKPQLIAALGDVLATA